MTTDTGKPLTDPAREAAWQALGTLGRTAAATRGLVESDRELTTASLLADIAAMEAILKRLRQAIGASPSLPL